MYYNVDNTLSRNRLFNFVVGPRGAGKTYGAKDRVMRNWLKHREQFVYLRRYDTEMPAAQMRNFFDDISGKYPDYKWEAGKGLFKCDKEIIGWYFPLSKGQLLKSIPFPNVTLIVFDEFIIDVGIYRYLPKEVHTFLEVYSTISRDRDVPVLFLSNAITFTNPYFIYFDLSLETGQKLKLRDDISLELVENAQYIEHASHTRFGKLIGKTEYGNYAISNTFLRDNEVFIEKPREETYYICTLIIEHLKVGVYRGKESGLYYSTDKADPSAQYKIALNRDDHDITTLYSRAGGIILREVVAAYCRGEMRFSTIKIKNLLCESFKGVI